MAIQRKAKKKKEEMRLYELQIEDWSVYYSVSSSKNILVSKEHSEIFLHGKLEPPYPKDITRGKIHLYEDSKMDQPSEPIGNMTVTKAQDILTLVMVLHIPSRLFSHILSSIAAEKIRFSQVYGTTLKYHFGTISWINLATHRTDEED